MPVCQHWVFVKIRADPHRVCGNRERNEERESWKKICCYCTFHGDWRRTRCGERVNIGEGTLARLIKGLDAECVRGRLIKPLDFVCVARPFVQGDKSAMTGA